MSSTALCHLGQPSICTGRCASRTVRRGEQLVAKRVRFLNRCRTAGLLIAIPALSYGCATPSEPPEPPSGGQELNLSFVQFEQTVAPILTQHGCDAGGDCHGGGIRGSLELSPQDAKDAQFDFDQVALQVMTPAHEQSPILTEPLAVAAGGTTHGVEPFATTAHPDYQQILSWIEAGVQP